MLVRRPSVLVMPLLAAIVALVLSQIAPYLTDQLGGLVSGVLDFIKNVVYGFAFGAAIIQADDIIRAKSGAFDAAWEEARRKAGGIILAVVGFWFLLYVAQFAGALVGLIGQVVLMLVAAFFLIYTIPASAIGGLPGSLAIGGSFRAVRADIAGAAVLAVAFFVLFIYVPPAIVATFAATLMTPVSLGAFWGSIVVMLVLALLQAIALAYLAFPFASQYEDVAFHTSIY